MSKHARLGPSNTRWPYCPGSIREEESYPDIAGEAAIDGTGSHLLLEMCLQNNVPAIQYDQQIIGANHEDQPNGWLVAPDRIARVQMCLDYVTRRVTELKEQFPGCNVAVESEGHSDPGAGFGRTDWWGTCDITITARHPMTGEVYFIEVCDYKDGRMYVSEKQNTQLNSYLFGKMLKYIEGRNHNGLFNHLNIKGCRMTICQPKTNPVIRYVCSTHDAEFSVKSVIDKAKQLAVAAALTDDADALLVPGKHCQWCKANPKRGGRCTAETEQSLNVVENMNTELAGQMTPGDTSLHDYFSKAIADVKALTVNRLAEIADAEPGIQAVFDKVKAEIEQRIDDGVAVPGYAKLPGNAKKVYSVDDKEVEKKLKACRLKKSDIYPSSLISPAAMLKLKGLTDVQKERLAKEIISEIGGKLSLKKVERVAAIEDDKDAAMMFADVPTTDVDIPQWVTEGEMLVDEDEGHSVTNGLSIVPDEEVSFF
jgi:hypothetical protein